MKPTKIVSFDLDGTLTDMAFVDSVWLEGVPKLFARKHKVSFADARRMIKEEYDRVGKERLEWYDLNYWLRKFDLDATPKQVLNSFVERIRIFEDVPGTLRKLKNDGERLIVITNAHREFVDLELDHTGIKSYFEHVFSSTSDYSLTKNGTTVYEKVCAACGVLPNQMVHIGDDPNFDFEVPRRIGISSFLLDRTRKGNGQFIVSSLEEFMREI